MKDREERTKAIIIAVIAVVAIAMIYAVTSGDGGNGGNGGGPGWDPYEFDENAHYEYLADTESGQGTFTWDFVSVSGDRVTADVTWNFPGESESMRVSGTMGEIYGQISEENARLGPVVSMTVSGGIPTALLELLELSVGNSWSVPSSGGTYTVEIPGKETYGGRESYVLEARLDENLAYRVAVSEDLGFPTYVVAYDASENERTFEVTLQEYSS